MEHQHGTLENIALDLIDLEVSNHRQTDDASIKDLAESIRVHGLMEPVSVYRKLSGEGRYILGFGHRRLAAHKLLKLETIRAVVHAPAPEAQIRAAQAVENLHRKDLAPLEEAQACQQLVVSIQSGQDVPPTDDVLDQAAAMVGRTRAWFENRLALMRLSPKVQKLLQDNRLYLAHAHYIARLPEHEAQEEVAEACAAEDAYGEKKGDREMPLPIWHCRGMVEDRLQDLSKVPWELDAEFDGKVACAKCPHNSANQPGLFDGDQPKKPMCLEGSCFKEKTRFAALAVLRASNTLAKQGKITPANAKASIEEREVGFVKPKAVMEAAETKLKPERSTKGERSGRQLGEKVRQETEAEKAQREAFQEAQGNWRSARDKAIAAKLRESPARCALMMLIQLADDWDDVNSDWRNEKLVTASLKKFAPTLARLKNASAKSVLELVEDIMPASAKAEPNWPLDDWNGLGNDVIGHALAETLGVTVAARPKLEDFKKDEPKAAKPKGKKAA